MAATFSSILPRISTILEAIVLDGDSGRSITAPLGYPKMIDSSLMPVIIMRMSVPSEIDTSPREWRLYQVSVQCTLYLQHSTSGIELLNGYDLLGYADILTDTFISYARLEDTTTKKALSGMAGDVVFSGNGLIPTLLPYPRPNGVNQFWAMEFSLSFPFKKLCQG